MTFQWREEETKPVYRSYSMKNCFVFMKWQKNLDTFVYTYRLHFCLYHCYMQPHVQNKEHFS